MKKKSPFLSLSFKSLYIAQILYLPFGYSENERNKSQTLIKLSNMPDVILGHPKDRKAHISQKH